MAERRSTRNRLPSLKAELNQLSDEKIASMKNTPKAENPNSNNPSESEDSVSEAEEEKNEAAPEQASEGKKEEEEESPVTKTTPTTGTKPEEDVKSKSSTSTVLDIPEELPSMSEHGVPSRGIWLHYSWLREKLPGREIQLQLLLTLLGEKESAVPPAIYVYGNSGVGKTFTLQTLFKELLVPHTVVNCTECYSSRLLFETVLNRLSKSVLTSKSGYTGLTRCDNMMVFISQLQQLIDCSWLLKSQTVYIVLDHCERLREMEFTVLPALLRLSSLCGRSVCVILVSQLVYEAMFSEVVDFAPVPIFFPDYTKAEVLAIMSLDCPRQQPLPFFKTFVNHIWNVFSHACKDLSELRHLSSLLFAKYVEPVEQGEIGSHETRRLWYHIQPYFKDVMSHVYLREVSSRQWMAASGSVDTARGVVSEVRGHLELPHLSKYLLLAAYLASYNPANTDKRFFSKKGSKVHKSRRQHQRQKPNYQLLGPKVFPLDRLMAIFYSILTEPVSPTASIYSQVSTLVTLQLMAQVSSRDVLDVPKYKCLVNLDFIRKVARSVGFDIVQYLYDFN